MEKIFRSIGIIILVIGAGMIVYPAIVSLITQLNDANFLGAVFAILPLVTFFWLTSQLGKLEKIKRL